MILLDIAQVSLANLFKQLGNHTDAELDENMIRHMILNSIRAIRKKFGDGYGELVIACDNARYWRKDRFPYYKANRRKSRDGSEIDWNLVFSCLRKIRDEIRDNFPYRVVDADGAEADDVIAVLAAAHADPRNEVMIVSRDKDFLQLQTIPGVVQFDPIGKQWMRCDDPKRFLHEHVLRGDVGDGIPNFRSADDCLVNGVRQTPVGPGLVERLWRTGVDESTVSPSELRGYQRNLDLIDLSRIPSDVVARVIESYESEAGKDRSRVLDYMITHRLRNLTASINDF